MNTKHLAAFALMAKQLPPLEHPDFFDIVERVWLAIETADLLNPGGVRDLVVLAWREYREYAKTPASIETARQTRIEYSSPRAG